jgi:hypothetical protein
MADQAQFDRLVERMLGRAQAGTTYGAPGGAQRAFGATSLKANGRIFAMLVKGRLVVKLDRRRVDELVAAGTGERFDPGHGRIQKEWLAVRSEDEGDWLDLAIESEGFVAGR